MHVWEITQPLKFAGDSTYATALYIHYFTALTYPSPSPLLSSDNSNFGYKSVVFSYIYLYEYLNWWEDLKGDKQTSNLISIVYK